MTYTLIQALRGLLCVGVVFMHIKIYLSRMGDPSIFEYIPYILGGIPCGFFAISGYFMAFLVDRNAPNFLMQRLVRVYPMYVIVVGMSFVLRAFTSTPLNFDDMFQVMSLLPFGMGKSYKLGIEWTLVYEIWYYFICAFFCRPKWNKRFPAFLLVWLFAQIITDTLFFKAPQPVPNVFQVWLSIWNYSFIMGALTFYYLQRRQDPVTLAWAGQVVFASAVAYSTLYMKAYDVLYLLGFLSCLLVDWLIKLEYRFRSPRILAQLGDYSYALYLVHSNIIILVLDRWIAVTGQPPGLIAGLMALVLCMGAFWYLGQLDVYVHKRCKGWVNRAMPDGILAFTRRLLVRPAPAASPGRDGQ
ncbi:MAG: acyltransferase family protein [Thermodesulfobacteriota bacterium]